MGYAALHTSYALRAAGLPCGILAHDMSAWAQKTVPTLPGSVGPEWKIIVVKDGKITEEYEVVQILERKAQHREAYYSCEVYGEQNVSPCPSELVE